MKKLVRKQKKIQQAVSNFDVRNQLIQNLNQSAQTNYMRWIMALWLGSNTHFADFLRHQPISLKRGYIWAGYYCMVILDNAVSLLGQGNENIENDNIESIRSCQFKILQYLNNHYKQLEENPNQLYRYIESQIQNLPEKGAHHDILTKSKSLCLSNLTTVLHDPEKYWFRLDEFAQLDIVKQSNLGVFVNKKITCYVDKKLLARERTFADQNYWVDKLLVPTKDGLIIDGLYVRKKGSHCKQVVIALIGHFPNESFYISDSMLNYQNLFDSDIIFINHRNYSINAAKKASHITQLADDVVSFADYFHQHNKQVVLYGMCGGAPFTILAAEQLKQKQVPFKIIVDRFSTDFQNWLDYKAITRIFDYTKDDRTANTLFNNIVNSEYAFIIIFLVSTLLLLVMKVMLTITRSNINFGKILKTIPEEDQLVLQAKSHKRLPNNEPVIQDIYILPERDLRSSQKENRQRNKTCFRKLISICEAICSILDEKSSLYPIFSSFKDGFQFFIDLINNEKLTSSHVKENNTKPIDGHIKRLFELSTRNDIESSDNNDKSFGLANFLQGFFKKLPSNWCQKLFKIEPYSVQQIERALNHSSNREESFTESDQLPLLLQQFFTEIVSAQKPIYNYAKRAKVMERYDLSQTISQLMSTKFYQTLKESNVLTHQESY
ncbi:hypothetical protein [Legionella sp. W05-934-2]|jgi:hypothetical protein|uniref:hypothetical protein n=1 Tax=Legionella sp. W05-934-2 TaxID=1198649 RepID=UPI0034630953